uniref:hypothetical protein n=1 Tax=Escherichia coli TaxID=562 RepID=UPI0005C6E585
RPPCSSLGRGWGASGVYRGPGHQGGLDETLAALVAEATSPDRIRADSIAASVPSEDVTLDGHNETAPTP